MKNRDKMMLKQSQKESRLKQKEKNKKRKRKETKTKQNAVMRLISHQLLPLSELKRKLVPLNFLSDKILKA